MPWYGAYTLDVYCDCDRCENAVHERVDGQYVHPTHDSGAIRMARAEGWIFKRDGRVIWRHCKGNAKTRGSS